MKKVLLVGMVIVLSVFVLGVRADTFTTNNPSGTGAFNFNIDFVTVGDAGNAGTGGWQNTPESLGAVAYNYKIGKTEISVAQIWAMEYSITGDASNLYSNMAAGGQKGLKMMQYVNWLNSGCKTGGVGLLDGGVYNMTSWTTIEPWAEALQWDNGDGTKNIWRNKNATYFLPTENELVKAAFYKGGSTNAGYWYYPTSSDTAPAAEGVSAGTNSANYNGAVGAALAVGSYPNTQSPYGALDMAGNLWEACEVRYSSGTNQYIPGWNDGYIHGAAWLRGTIGFEVLQGDVSDLGFRIASVPEPATLAILTMGSLVVIRRKRS
jgi:hypothetical protein